METYIPSCYILNGFDNVASVVVKECSSLFSLQGLTKVELSTEGGLTFDSDTYPSLFDWLSEPGIVFIRFGEISHLVPNGVVNANLFLFDTVNTNGIYAGKIRILK